MMIRTALTIPILLLLLPAAAQAKWIQCPGRQIWVEESDRFRFEGVEVYYADISRLAFVDEQSGKTLACTEIGPGWDLRGFQSLPLTQGSEEKLTAFEIQGGSQRRFFEIRSGKEVFPVQGAEELALAPSPDEAPGTGLKVLEQWSGGFSRIMTPEFHLILNRQDWQRLWERHLGAGVPVPQVNFRTSMVLAVMGGQDINSQGIGLVAVREYDDRLQVDYQHQLIHAFGQDLPTQPFGIFVLPRVPMPVILREDRGVRTGENVGWVTVQEFPAPE